MVENETPIATATGVYAKEPSFGVEHLQLLHVGVEPLLSLHGCEQLALLSEGSVVRHHHVPLTHTAASGGAPAREPASVQRTNTQSAVSWIRSCTKLRFI